jgi:hypothetical protein
MKVKTHITAGATVVQVNTNNGNYRSAENESEIQDWLP